MSAGDPAPAETRGPTLLTVAAGVVAIALLVTLSALLYGRAQDSLADRSKAQVRDATTLAAQLVGEQTLRFSELVQSHASHLSTLSDGPVTGLDGRQRAAVVKELRDVVGGTRGLRSAGLLTPDGRLLITEPAAPEFYGRSFADRDYYTGVMHESPYVSRVFESVRKLKTVIVAARVRDPRGRTIAILTVGLERRTQELVAQFSRSQGLGLLVTDQGGSEIARSGVSSEKIVSRADDPLVRAALRGDAGTDTGGDEIAAYAPVPTTGWAVITRLPESVALADVHDLRTLAIVLTAIIGLLLAGLTAGVVRFQRRAESLRAAAAQRAHAVHLHDGVVQTLTVAQIAREAGDHTMADRAVQDALEESKRITADLLPDDVSPGDLVRPDQQPSPGGRASPPPSDGGAGGTGAAPSDSGA